MFQREHAEDNAVLCLLYGRIINHLLPATELEDTAKWELFMEKFEKYLALPGDITESYIRKSLLSTYAYQTTFTYLTALNISSVVAFHFRKVLNEERKKTLLEQKTIKICSFESGCAAEVLAIINVLLSFQKKQDFQVDLFLSNDEWLSVCTNVLDCIGFFGKESWKIRVHLLDPNCVFTSNIAQAIQEADILTAVSLFTLYESRGQFKDMHILQNLMKPSAILLKIDQLPTKKCELFNLLRKQLLPIYKAVSRFPLLLSLHFQWFLTKKIDEHVAIEIVTFHKRPVVMVTEDKPTAVKQKANEKTQKSKKQKQKSGKKKQKQKKKKQKAQEQSKLKLIEPNYSMDSDDDSWEEMKFGDAMLQVNMCKGKICRIRMNEGMKRNFINTQLSNGKQFEVIYERAYGKCIEGKQVNIENKIRSSYYGSEKVFYENYGNM